MNDSVDKAKESRKLTGFERQQQAVKLRAAGLDYAQIAEALGYASKSGAHKAVQKAVARIATEGVSELRSLHSLRLNQIIAALWTRRGEPKVARAILGAMEREAALYGLDAPSKLEIGRLLESEDWQRVKATLKAALQPWPDAARAVADALREVGDE